MSHRPSTRTLFGLLLLFVLSCAAIARAQGHSIRGKVRGSSGFNLPRITVDLQTGNGALIQQTVTNNEGDFFFSGLTDNSYNVAVSAPDFNPTVERVEFFRATNQDSPGETRTIEIILNAKAGMRLPRAGLNFVQNVPKTARDAYELSLKLLKGGRAPESLAGLQEAIKIFPDYFDARFLLASEYSKQGKLSEAITQLNEVQRINPKDDRVWHAFGVVMMRQQKYAVAARIFAEATRLSPADAQYPLLAGTALIEQATMLGAGKKAEERDYALAEAEKFLTRAHELSNRKLAAVQLQFARLYEKKGERARAAAALEQYLKQTPNAPNAPAIRDVIKTLRAPATDKKSP